MAAPGRLIYHHRPDHLRGVLRHLPVQPGRGELYVPDMSKPVKIKDLAEKMIRLYGTDDEKIVYTGLRPGEKLYEELLRDEENDVATEKDRIFIAKQDPVDQETIQTALTKLEHCLDSHGDVKKVLAEIVPTYKAT